MRRFRSSVPLRSRVRRGQRGGRKPGTRRRARRQPCNKGGKRAGGARARPGARTLNRSRRRRSMSRGGRRASRTRARAGTGSAGQVGRGRGGLSGRPPHARAPRAPARRRPSRRRGRARMLCAPGAAIRPGGPAVQAAAGGGTRGRTRHARAPPRARPPPPFASRPPAAARLQTDAALELSPVWLQATAGGGGGGVGGADPACGPRERAGALLAGVPPRPTGARLSDVSIVCIVGARAPCSVALRRGCR
jgi:hypothetical protein